MQFIHVDLPQILYLLLIDKQSPKHYDKSSHTSQQLHLLQKLLFLSANRKALTLARKTIVDRETPCHTKRATKNCNINIK